MTQTVAPNRTLDRRNVPRLLGIAVAFLVGVLVTTLVTPERNEIVAAGGAGSGSGIGQGTLDASGEPIDAGATGPDGAGADGGRTGGGDSSGGAGGSFGGGAAGSGEAGSSGGAGAAGGGGRGSGPGVSNDAIAIGFGLPDLGAIAALGPGYDQGNPQNHVEGILAQLRADGRLPVHGRDIEPVFRSYNILSAEEQRGACESFGNDVAVFAVIAIHDFADGNECSAREFGIPTFTSDGSSDAVMARSAPNMFTMQMTADRLMRNMVRWADSAGFFTGKRIGVYSSNDPEAAKSIRDNLLNPIRALKHTIASHVETTQEGATTGGPQDSVAVQRFQTDRVDVAILVVSAIAKTNFFNQAEIQGYRPLYLENDIGFSTTDTATGTYPPAHFDKTPAITGMRFGENNSGTGEPEPARWCRAAIKKQTGNDIPRKGRDAEYIAANQACDEIMVVLHGLEQAGRGVTRARFIAGVETIRNRTAGIHGNLTFSPGRHDGVRTWRQIRWHASCTCWKVDGPLRPLLVD